MTYIFGMEHDIHITQSANALQTTRALLRGLKCPELWSANGLKLDHFTHPP